MKRSLLAAGIATTIALSGTVHAQTPAAAPPPPASPNTQAPTPVQPSGPAPAISDQARRHFEAGVALLQDPEGEKVEEAYRQFKTAYDLSGSPKILGNMGFCAMRLERDGEAIDAYSRYLREVSDIDPEERAQIVRDLQTLTVGVARISLEVTPPGATILDERVPVRGPRVTNAYGPVSGKLDIGVRPGHHVFTAKLPGREDASWELEAYAGAKEAHTFTLKEPPKAPPPPSVAGERHEKPSAVGPIVLTAAGGAMLVASGITGIVALNKTSDLEDVCKNNVCPRSFDLAGARSDARTFVGVTDLLLVLGTVTVLGGLYWGYRVASAGSEPKAAALPKPPTNTGFLSDWRLSL
jgi:hypothetical protein